MNTLFKNRLSFPALPGDLLEHRFFQDVRDGIPVNISEEDDTIQIEMPVPGFRKEQLQLNLGEDNLLRLDGQPVPEEAGENRVIRRKEFSLRPFQKTFQLGKGLDPKGIKARFQDGILTIHIPKIRKTGEPSAHKIEVE